MKNNSNISVSDFQKIMLKGGMAAAAPGIVSIVAAFTATLAVLQQYIGMGRLGTAAVGVIFLGAAYFLSRGHWWACIPSILFTGWVVWILTAKAVRLLILYFTHNPIFNLKDIIAPLPLISFQLILLIMALTLGIVILKTFLLCRSIKPQPVNRLVLGSLGLWLVVIVLDCMNKIH